MVLLTDLQVSAITNAARPLPPERAAFMAALLEALLMRRDELGDGELHRTLRELQRRQFRPPAETEDRRQGARL
jgi:hypothetical protein